MTATANLESVLLTDLYQLTMLNVYQRVDMHDTAVFEFFVRSLPEGRNFLVAAGQEQVLDYLENLAFSEDELSWLKESGHFDATFVDQLADFRFTGDVYGMPEGSLFFANEPVLRVVAPLPQAQLVESRLINLMQYQTLVASKAARCVLAGGERSLIDFGMRRAHGAEAALFAARAAYIAGFTGTATVLAERVFGIPCFGTMAHSFIQAHDEEMEAFENFARHRPDAVTLLIDTYDTYRGARRTAELARRLRRGGTRIQAVRIDSGDLASESRIVRGLLDEGGCGDIRIFVSGDLDEYRLQDLVASGAPIDGFGVGTRLDASTDAPTLNCVYKLQEYAGQARRKRSPGKQTWPGRKQVFRQRDARGRIREDILGLEGEHPGGEPLLAPLMRGGRRVQPAESLDAIRHRCSRALASLPQSLAQLTQAPAYPVTISDGLDELTRQVDRRFD